MQSPPHLIKIPSVVITRQLLGKRAFNLNVKQNVVLTVQAFSPLMGNMSSSCFSLPWKWISVFGFETHQHTPVFIFPTNREEDCNFDWEWTPCRHNDLWRIMQLVPKIWCEQSIWKIKFHQAQYYSSRRHTKQFMLRTMLTQVTSTNEISFESIIIIVSKWKRRFRTKAKFFHVKKFRGLGVRETEFAL